MGRAPGLTELQQGRVLAYAAVKMSIRDITKAVGRSKSAVHMFLKSLSTYGTKKSTGRPRQLKTHDFMRLKRYASVRTVQRELQRSGYLAYVKANKTPRMIDRHMKQRVEWVERQLRERTGWSRVVFSDEKKFNLNGPGGCKYYWYGLRTEKKVARSRHSGGGSVMVWGGISSLDKTHFAALQGNQDAFDYQQTLTTHLFEFIDGIHDGNYVFQHDNASIYHARATKDFLTDLNIATMNWPALPPDLNPIENVWGLMARKVYKNGRQYSTVSELKDAVLAAWDEITTDLLIKLSKSMTDRCIAVVRSKGKKIAY